MTNVFDRFFTFLKNKRVRFPVWAFVSLSFIYFELLLYVLIGVSYSSLAWLYLMLTGAAFGTLLGALIELVKRRLPRKVIGVFVFAIAPLLFCVEYFVFKSFMTCMNLPSILSGGGDVATGFTSVTFNLILKGFWVILLYYLPLVIWCVFFNFLTGRKDSRIPLIRIGAALLLQVLCIGIINFNPKDSEKLYEQYNFDTAVHTFGLTNAFGLDFLNSVGGIGGSDITDFEIMDSNKYESDDTSLETDTDTEAEDVPIPVVYGKNEMGIDFASLAENEKKSDVAKLHSYIASLSPSSQNEYTGIFEGKNLILITAEAFSAEVIDPIRTPTLYRLATKGINFKEYYQPAWGGSTSTGEYSILMGLVPTNGVKSIKDTIGNNLYFTMGNQLTREGYYSVAYHNNSYTYYDRNKTHTNFGYSEFIGMGNGMEAGVGKRWPASDDEMMRYTFDLYADKQPFSVYYMTVSGHCLYNWTGNSMSARNRNQLADMNASETIKAYHAANLELEKGLSYIVSELEARGMADDTVIVISTDHYPYGLEHSETWGTDKDYLSELYGYTPSNIFERDHSALIIWSGSLEDREEPIVVETPTYSLDILPTLSNLFGFEYDSRLLVGRDVFSEDIPLAIWANYSWVSDKGCYNSNTGVFTPRADVEVDSSYVDRVKAIVKNKMNFSKSVVALDYYNVLFGNG